MVSDSHPSLIDRYIDGAERLSQAIAGLSNDELHAFPIPGAWSIKQIVIHLLDSDLIHADRIKRVIAEEKPLLMGFNESKFASRLHYEAQDAALAAELFAKNRQLLHQVLSHLPTAAFERSGIHSERGRVTLADLIATAVDHLDHHLKFIQKKRALLGKAQG
ncbi:MAG: DinB family protein [Pirellulales bacterium]|nr:DinB family protein [Pirellulales bacterium]